VIRLAALPGDVAVAPASAPDALRFLDDCRPGDVLEAVEDSRRNESVAAGLGVSSSDRNSISRNTSFGLSTLRKIRQPLDSARARGLSCSNIGFQMS
jgi:hypothetical protein